MGKGKGERVIGGAERAMGNFGSMIQMFDTCSNSPIQLSRTISRDLRGTGYDTRREGRGHHHRQGDGE